MLILKFRMTQLVRQRSHTLLSFVSYLTIELHCQPSSAGRTGPARVCRSGQPTVPVIVPQFLNAYPLTIFLCALVYFKGHNRNNRLEAMKGV